MDDCDKLIPEWLNVVKGVVDSEDLSLNSSRKTLQQNKISRVIEENHVKKRLEMFAEIAELSDDVKEFPEQLGKGFELGVRDDSTVGAKIGELLRPNVSDKVVDVPVDMQRQAPAVQVVNKTAEVPQIRFIDRVVDTPVVQQRQVPTVQTVQKTMGNPQAQFLDAVVSMPVVVQRKVPMIQRVQKTVEVPKTQYVDKVVEAPVAAAQQPVPVDADSFLRVEDVSVGTQTVSRKRKISMETESAESADGASDTEHGLVQGVGGSRREMDETRERHAAGEDLDLLPVAPNMEAGGSHLHAITEEERIEIWTQDLREIRRMVEFLVHRERKLDVKADVAISRLEPVEKENLQLEDEALEAGLPEALADKTKVVKLLVDKWFVDKGFGFGKSSPRRSHLHPRQRCPRCRGPHDWH